MTEEGKLGKKSVITVIQPPCERRRALKTEKRRGSLQQAAPETSSDRIYHLNGKSTYLGHCLRIVLLFMGPGLVATGLQIDLKLGQNGFIG